MAFISADDLRSIIQHLVLHAGESGVFTARVNDLQLNVPAPMLAMFPHCLHSEPYNPFLYYIETKHLNWILSRLSPGDCAIDVGASGGLLSSAMALKVGPTGHIFAFEPARRALWLLHRIIRFNDIDNITVVPKAASDSSGKADFTEYAYDPQASIAWIPEASTIGTPDTSKRCQSYEVETVSLDDFIAATDRKIIAIKIDVEGFELHVLRGARALLERDRPVLSIDIHQRIDDLPGTTEEEARTFLSSLGYAFSTLDHVLLAECAVTSTAHAKKHPHSEL